MTKLVWSRGTFVKAAIFALMPLGTLRAQEPGAPVFAANCAGCHGADGRGGEHAPNIATAPQVQHLMDRELAAIIRNGVSGAGMPAFPSLEPRKVAEVVSYLRFLQGREDLVKLPGDPVRGKALFFGKAQCAECHMVNGKGGFIGSDLSYYGAEAKPDQMRGIILNPEKNLPIPKKAVTVVTNTGQTISGMLKINNNFSITLQTLDGSFRSFPKSDLSQVEIGSHSLMPASNLDNTQLDDLISYLLQTGNQNVTSKPLHASGSDDDDN